MRIALVSGYASPLALAVPEGTNAGGQSAHVAGLATGLARRGHEVTVHTGPRDPAFCHMDAFAGELSARWAKRRPDVVHSHFWTPGYASVRAARPLGVPVLHTFHVLGVAGKREQGVRGTLPREPAEIAKYLLNSTDRILATSPGEVLELLRLGGDRSRITVVPRGVDTCLFTPEGPAARRGAAPRILYAGPMTEREGVGNLITALHGVPGAELVIAGGPAPEFLDRDPDIGRLRALADKHGVRRRVRFLGRVPHARLPELYRGADVVACVPWYESSSIVPVEAMACGAPVVVAAVGGLTDIVVDSVTGVHVPPRRPGSIAAALRGLLEDPERRRRLGAAGRERASRHYAMDRVISGTLRAYHAAVDARVRADPRVSTLSAAPKIPTIR